MKLNEIVVAYEKAPVSFVVMMLLRWLNHLVLIIILLIYD